MLNDRAFVGSPLCVVGNINRDIKTAAFKAGAGLFQDGETSTPWIAETIGGGGANSAFAAASLGARVSFLGKVGADELGSRLQRTLERHGISPHLARDPARASGTSIALAFDSGQRHFISCLPANEALSYGDLDAKVLKGHDHLLRADIWFSKAMLFEGNKQLFQLARKSGVAVSIDLNWDPQWGRASVGEIAARKQAVRDVLPLVNLAHGNARELMGFADAPDLEVALKRLVDWGVEAVVVHLGGRGAGFYSREGFVIEPPAPVKASLNSTGTGDLLSVCMMLLHRRADIAMAERLRLANGIVAEFIEGTRKIIPPLE